MDATNFANCEHGNYTAAGGYFCSRCKSGYTYSSPPATTGNTSTTKACVATTTANCTVSNCKSCVDTKICATCDVGYTVLMTDSSCV